MDDPHRERRGAIGYWLATVVKTKPDPNPMPVLDIAQVQRLAEDVGYTPHNQRRKIAPS